MPCRDLVTTWASALDAWTAPFGGAAIASSNLVVLQGPAAGVPAKGYGFGGSTMLAAAPVGSVSATALDPKPAGGTPIAGTNVEVTVSGTTLTVKLKDAGPVAAGLYVGAVTAGGSPIATVIVHLF